MINIIRCIVCREFHDTVHEKFSCLENEIIKLRKEKSSLEIKISDLDYKIQVADRVLSSREEYEKIPFTKGGYFEAIMNAGKKKK